MLVTKTVKTVINISKLSPTHFICNIRHQHRCSQFKSTTALSLKEEISNGLAIDKIYIELENLVVFDLFNSDFSLTYYLTLFEESDISFYLSINIRHNIQSIDP